MRNEAYPVSPMSRHPDLNRRPTDYECVEAPLEDRGPEAGHRHSKHDSGPRSTTRPRWMGCLAVLALAGCWSATPEEREARAADARRYHEQFLRSEITEVTYRDGGIVCWVYEAYRAGGISCVVAPAQRQGEGL